MTNNIRVFLWLALGLALFINYSQWQQDYAPKAPPPAATATTTLPDGTVIASKPAAMSDTVPQAAQSPGDATSAAVPEVKPEGTAVEAAPSAATVHVVTDVLDVEISLTG